MKTFNDNAGRVWTVAINVDAIKRVRGLTTVNLLEIVEGTLIERLIRDPVLLCDVVYAVCKPQADAQGIGDEDFGRAMAGDAIEGATRALLEELVGFSPSRQTRANLQRVLEATWRVMARAEELVAARIEGGALEKVLEQALQTASGSSGSAPASPAPSPQP